MVSTQFQYVNGKDVDPVDTVDLMFGAEFVATVRGGQPGVIRVTDWDGHALAPDEAVHEVVCDLCNVEIDATAPCALAHNRLYCWSCADEWIRPYLLADAPVVTK